MDVDDDNRVVSVKPECNALGTKDSKHPPDLLRRQARILPDSQRAHTFVYA